jgi:hypothetical protein
VEQFVQPAGRVGFVQLNMLPDVSISSMKYGLAAGGQRAGSLELQSNACACEVLGVSSSAAPETTPGTALSKSRPNARLDVTTVMETSPRLSDTHRRTRTCEARAPTLE